MHDQRMEIDRVCEQLGARAPLVTFYANGLTVALRNGDDDRVVVFLPLDADAALIEGKLTAVYKVKAGNLARDDSLKRAGID